MRELARAGSGSLSSLGPDILTKGHLLIVRLPGGAPSG